ncbi:hypothetical protein [Gimesia aquarii]|uniref:Uncharacterized protein n=1 Tax=Gimesia aquarii TaxID=2527964 RepID=A0A517VRA3_9PLAN|nr:hypothetical protein [Gimesia aquarii]QDT95554.1 hypothetical protein V144x_09990 [Gimesia aquarii]
MINFFIPNKSGANPKHLIEVGLETLLSPNDNQPLFHDLAGPGPDNLSGQIVSWQDEGLAYRPDQQEWFEIPADRRRKLPKGRYWIGSLKGAKPTAVDFARNSMLPGQAEMLLGDGQYWKIPNCSLFPMQFSLGTDGETTKVPRPEFKRIFERTVWAMDLLETSIKNDQPIDEEPALDYCIEMLNLNYRVNREIVLWLNLLSPERLPQLMAHSTDTERITKIFEEVKKKGTP